MTKTGKQEQHRDTVWLEKERLVSVGLAGALEGWGSFEKVPSVEWDLKDERERWGGWSSGDRVLGHTALILGVLWLEQSDQERRQEQVDRSQSLELPE